MALNNKLAVERKERNIVELDEEEVASSDENAVAIVARLWDGGASISGG